MGGLWLGALWTIYIISPVLNKVLYSILTRHTFSNVQQCMFKAKLFFLANTPNPDFAFNFVLGRLVLHRDIY